MGESETVFGKPLTELHLNGDGIPYFVKIVFEYLMTKVTTEGIFRRSGSDAKVTRLGQIFAQPGMSLDPTYGVHEVASFLKRWLNTLPDPLITPEIVCEFLKPNEKRSCVDVLRRLKDVNRRCLVLVFRLLSAVIDNQKVNRMPFENLSACFLPALLQLPSKRMFAFQFFFQTSLLLIDCEGEDFLLEGPYVESVISDSGTSAYDSAPVYASGLIQLAATKLEPPQSPLAKTIPMNVTPRVIRPHKAARGARLARTVTVEEARRYSHECVEE